MDSLPARLAQASVSKVDGTWQRHVGARFADTALAGRSATGRWGMEDSYPVLYLGKPTASVTVEAYRHLIDPIVDFPAPPIRPRVLITCVSAAAHQLGYHGLVAPAATMMGTTLVLFTDLLADDEQPVRTHQEAWLELPADPRKPPQGKRLRIVR